MVSKCYCRRTIDSILIAIIKLHFTFYIKLKQFKLIVYNIGNSFTNITWLSNNMFNGSIFLITFVCDIVYYTINEIFNLIKLVFHLA